MEHVWKQLFLGPCKVLKITDWRQWEGNQQVIGGRAKIEKDVTWLPLKKVETKM